MFPPRSSCNYDKGSMGPEKIKTSSFFRNCLNNAARTLVRGISRIKFQAMGKAESVVSGFRLWVKLNQSYQVSDYG